MNINPNNWHNHLTAWEKMPWKWKVILKDPKYNNSQYGILDCGGDGDCLFHCIAWVLSGIKKQKMKAEDIRKLVSEQLNEDNYLFYLELYQLQKENNEFQGNWDPDNIQSLNEFQKIIETMGDTYLGDNICISLLENVLQFHILLFQTELNDNNQYNVEPYLLGTNYKYNHFILIHYYSDIHYQLIGKYNHMIKNMQDYFNKNDLDNIIIQLFGITE